jgi:hypothetical protein
VRLGVVALVALAACRTQPVELPPDLSETLADAAPHGDLRGVDRPRDLASSCPATVNGMVTDGYVACGGSKCPLPGSACCLSASSGFCGSPQQCRSQCDGPEDCLSDGGLLRCCLFAFHDGQVASCSTPCATEICHTSADCPPGMRCAVRAGLPTESGVCTTMMCGP